MQPDLAAYLARQAPLAHDEAAWGDGTMPLRITGYLTGDEPPLAYVTSVRSLVFRGDALLVLRNLHGTHILPGGRREAGETLAETLNRELLEEAGWTLTELSMLGVMHFHHLNPKPPDYPYVHPDFLWIVSMAEAVTFMPEAMVPDGYELEAAFRPSAEVQALALSPGERLYLDAALTRRSARRAG